MNFNENTEEPINDGSLAVEDFADGGLYAKETDATKFSIIIKSKLSQDDQLALLKTIKIDMNAPFELGNTIVPVFYCVLRLYSPPDTPAVIDALKSLIELGADVNARDSNGLTMLHKFVINDGAGVNVHGLSCVKFLLDNGADVYAEMTYDVTVADITTNRRENIFDMAFRNPVSNIDVVKLLIDNIDIDHCFEDNITVLMCAAANANVPLEVIQYIIDRGATVNAMSIVGLTALHHLLLSNRGREIVDILKLLIKSGANVNILANNTLSERYTPLTMAIVSIDNQNALNAVVKLLLSAGADVNEQNSTGSTALQLAFTSYNNQPGLLDVMMMLVDAGATIHDKYDINSKLLMKLLTELSQSRKELVSTKKDFKNTIIAFASRDALFKQHVHDDTNDKK